MKNWLSGAAAEMAGELVIAGLTIIISALLRGLDLIIRALSAVLNHYLASGEWLARSLRYIDTNVDAARLEACAT